MNFWNRVELLRKEKHITYRQLAAAMGVSETTVSSMRRASTEPRASEAAKIAIALETSVEYLTTGEAATKNDEYRLKYLGLKEQLKNILND